MIEEIKVKIPYVITGGDEGIQINVGIRLAFAGAGYEIPSFSKAVVALKKTFGENISIVSNHENYWIKSKMKLTDWNQVDASMQQQIEAIADKEGLSFAGNVPFSDPRKLKDEVKGHMVRPKGVHIGNKICFSLGGGEQVYNLGCFRISADWLHAVSPKVVKDVILPQIEFYNKLIKKDLPLFYELHGELDEKIANKNLKKLQKLGLEMEVLPER